MGNRRLSNACDRFVAASKDRSWLEAAVPFLNSSFSRRVVSRPYDICSGRETCDFKLRTFTRISVRNARRPKRRKGALTAPIPNFKLRLIQVMIIESKSASCWIGFEASCQVLRGIRVDEVGRIRLVPQSRGIRSKRLNPSVGHIIRFVRD